jgi:hypothetical protein
VNVAYADACAPALSTSPGAGEARAPVGAPALADPELPGVLVDGVCGHGFFLRLRLRFLVPHRWAFFDGACTVVVVDDDDDEPVCARPIATPTPTAAETTTTATTTAAATIRRYPVRFVGVGVGVGVMLGPEPVGS